MYSYNSRVVRISFDIINIDMRSLAFFSYWRECDRLRIRIFLPFSCKPRVAWFLVIISCFSCLLAFGHISLID